MKYHYDQLYRLTAMDAFMGLTTSSGAINWSISTPMPDYAERVGYDPNGNILRYFRNGTTAGGQPLPMDSLNYFYKPGTNQLDHVSDSVGASNYSVDIDNELPNNYHYDAIGNLTKDSSEHLDTILWTVYGKIWEIDKHNGDTIRFAYDPSGNRIMKSVYRDTTHRWKNTYYVHDATGNIMATYQWINMDTFILDDVPMYGSSRLGSWSPEMLLSFVDSTDSLHSVSVTNGIGYWAGGYKVYELNNHLGNVLSTISDRKLRVSLGGVFDHYVAEVMTATDYFPFGMPMPFRGYGAGYRFGFNGKEKDNEIEGGGNMIDFGARIYDPRKGQWSSVDNLFGSYPSISPFAFALNNPIKLVDKDGNVVMGTDNKPVTITYSPNGIQYSDNASADVKTLFAAMSQTKTGMEQIHKMDASKTEITIKLTQKVILMKVPDNEHGELFAPVFAMTGPSDASDPEKAQTMEVSLGSWDLLSNGNKGELRQDNVIVYDLTPEGKGKRTEDVDMTEVAGKMISDPVREKKINSQGPDRVADKELTTETRFLNVTGTHESVHTESKNIATGKRGGNTEPPAYKKERQSFEELKQQGK